MFKLSEQYAESHPVYHVEISEWAIQKANLLNTANGLFV